MAANSRWRRVAKACVVISIVHVMVPAEGAVVGALELPGTVTGPLLFLASYLALGLLFGLPVLAYAVLAVRTGDYRDGTLLGAFVLAVPIATAGRWFSSLAWVVGFVTLVGTGSQFVFRGLGPIRGEVTGNDGRGQGESGTAGSEE